MRKADNKKIYEEIAKMPKIKHESKQKSVCSTYRKYFG